MVDKVMNPGRDGTLAMWQMVAWKVIFASGCCPVAEEAVALMDTRMRLINDTLILPMDDKCLELEMTLVPKVVRVFSFCLPYLILPSTLPSSLFICLQVCFCFQFQQAWTSVKNVVKEAMARLEPQPPVRELGSYTTA